LLRPYHVPVEVVFFDFDGVILESVDIKTQAFRELFRDRPDELEAIVGYHLAHTGLSRYEKIRVVYRDLLCEPLTEGELDRLGRRFSELVIAQMLRCAFVPGAEAFLAKYAGSHRMLIASGTPEEELRDIVRLRGLAGYFRAVHGSPRTKEQILRAGLAEEGCAVERAVFVGDSLEDLVGARGAGVPFIARVRDGGVDPFRDEPAVARVRDLGELDARWSELTTALQRSP